MCYGRTHKGMHSCCLLQAHAAKDGCIICSSERRSNSF
jgi:hypothetical protein